MPMGQDPEVAGHEWTGIGHKTLIVDLDGERWLTDVGFVR
jgi:arylamine N-acetyltransferase